MTGVLTRRGRDTRKVYAQIKGHVRTQQGGHLKGKEKGLGRNPPCSHPDLELLGSRTVRKHFAVVIAAQAD